MTQASPTTESDLGAARQKGRGREAAAPTQIPFKAWIEIFKRVFAEIGQDRVMLVAAGVTFYLLLALVPALTAFVSIYGLVADRSTVVDHLQMLSGFVPAGGLDIIREQMTRLTAEGDTTLGWTLLVSLGIALWSASAGIKALFQAMNVAYEEEESRGFIKISILGLVFTLTMALGALVILAAVVVMPAVVEILPLGEQMSWIVRLVSYGAVFAVLVLGISSLYRWGPSRSQAKWRWVTPGASFAIVLIVVASALFSWYVSSFSDYNATYGSLGAMIAFLTWVWITVTLLILGAEINSEIEHQTARDSTTGPEKPMGERGAYVADTIG